MTFVSPWKCQNERAKVENGRIKLRFGWELATTQTTQCTQPTYFEFMQMNLGEHSDSKENFHNKLAEQNQNAAIIFGRFFDISFYCFFSFKFQIHVEK